MIDWQSIETAPTDGRKVYVKRIYKGSLISEQWAVYSTMSEDAPMRHPAPGGLYGPLPPDHHFANTPTWLTADRRFCVPGPTHWLPNA